MPSVNLKFETREEQEAFVRLLNLIPKRQGWDDVKENSDVDTCHICNSKDSVRSGIVPFDGFFENERVEGSYTFWNCCVSCHNKGWVIPHWAIKGHLEYWGITPLGNESSSRQAARYREVAFASHYRRKRQSIHSFLLHSDQMEAGFHLILARKNKRCIIKDFKLFKLPSICLVNLNTVLLSI